MTKKGKNWKNEYFDLLNKINEFNTLPWYKRIFRKIEQ